MDDHEVRFPVSGRAALAHRTEPLGVCVEAELGGGERGAESLDDYVLSGLPVRLHAPS